MNIFYFILGALISWGVWSSIEGSSRVYLVFSRSARKFYSRMNDMFGNIYCTSVNWSLQKSFCLECTDFVERSGRHSKHGRKSTYRWYTESDKIFYYLVMTKAYYKLLVSPFGLYSQLDRDQTIAYSCIYEYAAEKLVKLGHIDQAFLENAKCLLDEVAALCQERKAAGKEIDWG